MGILTSIFKTIGYFLLRTDYRRDSELWFDSVWRHMRHTSSCKGELFEKNGKVFRKMSVTFDGDISITITDDKDLGAKSENVRLSWWERTCLENTGNTVLKRYYK